MSTFSGSGGWGGWAGAGGWSGAGGWGGWAGGGGMSAAGGWAGNTSGSSGGYSPASILTTRDGIAGSWSPPSVTPADRSTHHPENLISWAPWVRAQLFDTELQSRLAFTYGAHSDGHNYTNVWHLEYDHSGTPPTPADPLPSNPPHPRVLANHLFSANKPAVATLTGQLELVRDYIDLRQDRLVEITSQLGSPEAFLGTISFLSPDRTPWTLELLGVVYRLALFVELQAKHDLAVRRPIEFSPQIQPIVPTPDHGSFPSGHATEAFALATTLSILLNSSAETPPETIYGQPEIKLQLLRLASRIAVNRTVAGVHYPIDSAVGALLGSILGQYVATRCIVKADVKYTSYTFDANAFLPDTDFDRAELFNGGAENIRTTPAYVTPSASQHNITVSLSPLTWLWDRALAEWKI